MSPAARVLRLFVLGYRRGLSPLLGPHCRFTPTCSTYALEALAAHGALRGSWLAVRRVARCHPFHPDGHDPVPPSRGSLAATPIVRTTASARSVSEYGGKAPRPAAGAPSSSTRRPPSPARRLGAPS